MLLSVSQTGGGPYRQRTVSLPLGLLFHMSVYLGDQAAGCQGVWLGQKGLLYGFTMPRFVLWFPGNINQTTQYLQTSHVLELSRASDNT